MLIKRSEAVENTRDLMGVEETDSKNGFSVCLLRRGRISSNILLYSTIASRISNKPIF